MKQKYTITVSDMELNIISDASPDEVENIVGILDRRMRDINLKSPRCTKNEAAILCALSYCSERLAMQEAFKKVENDAFRFAGENSKLKKTIEEMQEEIDRLRKDAAVMRSILDRAATAAIVAQPEANAPKGKVATRRTTDKAEDEAEQISVFEEPKSEDVVAASTAPAAPIAPVAPIEELAPSVEATPAEAAQEPAETKKTQKGDTKKRVGTMFDLLTFSDV